MINYQSNNILHLEMKSSENKTAPDIEKQVSNLQRGFAFGFGLNCGGGKRIKRNRIR